MNTSRLLILLLAGNLACQTKPTRSSETTRPAQADSAALLAKRPGPDAPRSAADRLVRALYFEHNKTDNPFRQKRDRTLIDQFFALSTADLIWKTAQRTGDKTGASALNPLFDAPDKAVHKTWVEPAAVVGARAVVYVTFLNNGQSAEIQLDLQQQAGRWRILEMHYPTGARLTQRLQMADK